MPTQYFFGYSADSQVNSITTNIITADANYGQALSSVVNSQFGPTSYQLGNNLIDIESYDVMGRNSARSVCLNSSTLGCSGGTNYYSLSQQARGQQVLYSSDSTLSSNNTFSYDEFNRLTASNYISAGTAFLYTYDRYGNRWAQTATQSSGNVPQYSATFDATTNRLDGFLYDAAGNLLNDNLHSYRYDAEGNLVSVDGAHTYIYDALNRRVQSADVYGATDYGYDAFGQRSTVWRDTGSTPKLQTATVFWNGQAFQTYTQSQGASYHHKDMVGSERLTTSYDRYTRTFTSSYPFGERNQTFGTSPTSEDYAGTQIDVESQTNHADFRQYHSVHGRWMSPDPYDGSYNSRDPQSLNRYSYVSNNPLGFLDPSGLKQEHLDQEVTVYADLSDYFDLSDLFWEYGYFGEGQGGGGGGQGGGGGAPNNPPPCKTGFGAGFAAGVDAGAGGLVNGHGIGAAGNAGIGGGLFGGPNGLDAGGFASAGGAASALGHGATYPSPRMGRPSILGAAGGVGVGFFLTNASQASQLSGPSLTLNVDLGWFANGAGQFSIGKDNAGNNIWSFTFTAGLGYGGLFHGVTNQTAAGGIRARCR